MSATTTHLPPPTADPALYQARVWQETPHFWAYSVLGVSESGFMSRETALQGVMSFVLTHLRYAHDEIHAQANALRGAGHIRCEECGEWKPFGGEMAENEPLCQSCFEWELAERIADELSHGESAPVGKEAGE